MIRKQVLKWLNNNVTIWPVHCFDELLKKEKESFIFKRNNIKLCYLLPDVHKL